jgi:hypothetical protein
VWPLIAEGQPVWLTLSGTKNSGPPYSKVIWAAGDAKVNATWIMDGYSTNNLPMADLKRLKDGSSLTITFKAGLDGTQVEANAVTFTPKNYTVRSEELEPWVSQVVAGDQSVGHGGVTDKSDLTVLVINRKPNSTVQLYDNGHFLEAATTGDDGNYTVFQIAFALGPHRLTAKRTDSDFNDVAFNFSVILLDTSPMRLDGLACRLLINAPTTGYEFPGNVEVRKPTTGAPFRFISSNPAIALVDAEGKVTGVRNGTAQITVTTAHGMSSTYLVTVTNVWDVLIKPEPGTHAQAMAWRSNQHGEAFASQFRALFWRYYAQTNPPAWPDLFWTCHAAGEEGCGLQQARRVDTGYSAVCSPLTQTYPAMCVRPT